MVRHAQNDRPVVAQKSVMRGVFALAASQPDDFGRLEVDLPEVAFWGRSNVGKSSLINAVTNCKGLARASNTPGRTQQIVFFNIEDRLMFADLPGYGYAKAPKAEIAKWNAFIRSYMKKQLRLRCVLLLIDARHGVMPHDAEKMTFLDDLAVPYRVVLTKADQAKGGAASCALAVAKILAKHAAAHPLPLVTCVKTGEGIEELREFLNTFATDR